MNNFKQYSQVEKWVFASIFLVLASLLSTDNGSVAIAGLTAIASIVFLYRHRSLIRLDKTDKLVVAVLSAYLLANVPLVIIDWDNMRYFRGASRIILCVPVYFFFKYLVDVSKVYISAISWGLLWGSIGAFALACYQFFYEGRPRVDGFLFSINFGYLACAMMVISLSLLSHPKYRGILVFSAVLSVMSLLMTLTRGSIIALPIIFGLAYSLNYRKLGLLPGFLGVVVLVGASIGLYTASDAIKKRVDFTVSELTSIANGKIDESVSAGGRIMLWHAAIEAFKQRPMLGLTHPEREALNQHLAEQGVVDDYTGGVKRGHAHSQYFDLLASGGILGIIALIFMLVVPFFYFFRYHQQSQAAYTGTLFVAAIAIFCLTEVALQQNLISTFYGYMLALLFAATQLELKKKGIKE